MDENKEGEMDQNLSQPQEESGGGKSVGPIVGIIIIIIIIILGGLYFWGQRLSRQGGADLGPDTQTQDLGDVSSSDDVTDIEGDLGDTTGADLDALDNELVDIEAELDSELGGL